MESRTSFKSILALTVVAVGIGYFMVWLQEDAAAQLQSLNEMVAQPIAHEQPEPEITPEMIVTDALYEMVKAYQYDGPTENKDKEAAHNCFFELVNVMKPALSDAKQQAQAVQQSDAACTQLLADADVQPWKSANTVERMLAAAVAYASIDPESLVALLSQQWNNQLYSESERAVLMGVLARATYLVDRDAVAGRVSCKADFSCRMSEALSLRDQTIAFTPTIDGLPRYRVAFVTTKIQAAVGYQMYTYEVSSKNGTVGAVAVPQ
jgi:hypothetical protein